MKLLDAVPILRIFSVDKAYEFYRGFLGFELAWEHRFDPAFPLYAEIRLGEVVLHLSEHHGDSTPGSTVFIPMRGVDALCQALREKRYPYAHPAVETVGWGRQMQIADPFGNRLRFCELTPPAA